MNIYKPFKVLSFTSLLPFRMEQNSERMRYGRPDALVDEETVGENLSRKARRTFSLLRIPMLLMLGYASAESTRRHERSQDWLRLHTMLMFKIENISIVSGLLLASSTNLLVAGDLRRMTHASVCASMFGSVLSIIFGLLCRINITPTRLKFLVTRTHLFYYLYATPSLFGGGAALAFFAAICAWTWLDDSTAQFGWGPRICAVLLSFALLGNALACFILGAFMTNTPRSDGEDGVPESNAAADPGQANEEALGSSGSGLFGIRDWSSNLMSQYDSRTYSSLAVADMRRAPPSRSFTFDSTGAQEVAAPPRTRLRTPAPARRNTAW